MEDRGEDSVVEREISRVNDVKGIASCNIHGSVYVNRVMGLFHITAGGHGLFVLYITPGYYGPHTPHDLLNFTHRIDELSFGIYPLNYKIKRRQTLPGHDQPPRQILRIHRQVLLHPQIRNQHCPDDLPR